MLGIKWTNFLPICVPLALAACSGEADQNAKITAANQKADQAMSTAQQALAEAQSANAKADRQFQQSLQK